jgi:hypothetical protein
MMDTHERGLLLHAQRQRAAAVLREERNWQDYHTALKWLRCINRYYSKVNCCNIKQRMFMEP